MKKEKPKIVAPMTGIAAGVGAIIGFAIGMNISSSSKGVSILANALARQMSVSQAAPIICTGITAFAALAGAVILPSIVWWVLRHAEAEEVNDD